MISDQLSSYKDDDVQKMQFVKDTLLDKNLWKRVDYILLFNDPVYDTFRRINIEALCLH